MSFLMSKKSYCEVIFMAPNGSSEDDDGHSDCTLIIIL